MSQPDHGENVDPDLTPMLDVVMQLLMYFIMCVNFLADEMTEDIKLPAGATARPIYKGEGDILLLGILSDGKVKVFGREAMDLPIAKQWLRNRYLEAENKSPDKQVHTAIVLRADLNTSYETVYQVLNMCKSEGFRRFKLRAEIRESS
jgi:biopolymer transport protein ExbD